MKKGSIFLILLVVLGLSVLVFQKIKGKISDDFAGRLPSVAGTQPSEIPRKAVGVTSRSIFVPYWTIGDSRMDFTGYDQVIYFGVAPDKSGINKQDEGFRRLEEFSEGTSSIETLITLRMIERDTALAILKDKTAQTEVISQTIDLAKEYKFSGIVLDLELTALPFDSLVNQITDFTTRFSDEAKKNNLQFHMTVYGDTFYRVRPFNIAALSKHVDSFLVMSYDLHKSGGNPGPNFPIGGRDTYGYDFETMLTHFLAYVPSEKMGIVYGMYGYDWVINAEGQAIGPGESLSLSEINNTIVRQCALLACESTRDEVSAETNIRYTDDNGEMHSVWFEDEASAKKKEDFARRFGVGIASFWAYSFF